MKYVGALLIAVLFLGVVAASQFFMTRQIDVRLVRDTHDDHEVVQEKTDEYRLVLTPTFSAVKDPFAIQLDNDETSRLTVKLGDRVLLNYLEDIQEGRSISVDQLHFDDKYPEVYIEASPSQDEAEHACALRIQVFNTHDVLCHDQTLWTEGEGHRLSQAIILNLEPQLLKLDRGLGESNEP